MKIIIRGFDANSISIQFEGGFSTSMLNAVRAVPGRTYNPQRKSWMIPCEQKSLDLLLENIYQTGDFNSVTLIPTELLRRGYTAGRYFSVFI